MPGRESKVASSRAITYCIVPAELADKLHEPLRRHFAEDPGVEVIVEQRDRDRRSRPDRRAEAATPEEERRQIRAATGRRVEDRRAIHAQIARRSLPARVHKYAEEIVFVERLDPGASQLEDADTARLVRRIQAGERDLFSELYMRYFDRVYGYLRVALRDEHSAEDLTQQVFVQVFEALPRYEDRGRPFRAWLFIIVRNLTISTLQKQGRLDVVDPHDMETRRERPGRGAADLSALNWISDRELLLFVERLPLAQRQVLLLRYLLDLTTDEIATILDRSATDIRTLDYRARGFLRDRLTALGYDARGGGVIRMRRWGKPATVLRSRRFALIRH